MGADLFGRECLSGDQVLGRDAEEAEEWVRSWTSQVSARAEAAAALTDRVSGITCTATGAGGAVRVTVGSSGMLTGLELHDRVQRMSGAELAAEILTVMRRAQAQLTDRVAIAVQDTVGADSETGRAVLGTFAQRFPAPPGDADGGPSAQSGDGRVR